MNIENANVGINIKVDDKENIRVTTWGDQTINLQSDVGSSTHNFYLTPKIAKALGLCLINSAEAVDMSRKSRMD